MENANILGRLHSVDMQSQPQWMGALEFNPRQPEGTGLISRCCQEKELSLAR